MSIEFKLTRDPRMLEQYYQLREVCFREELDLPDFDGSEDMMDRRGLILLAVQGERCIGGARISEAVLQRRLAHQLSLEKNSCCIWERFVIDPEVRTLQFIRDFCAELVAVSREAQYRHAMVLSSLRNARFYRQCHSALGVGFTIHRDVSHFAHGEFAGLEHYLSVAHLQGSQPYKFAA